MEKDLLARYPKSKRDLKTRAEVKTEAVRAVARQFGEEFFDGDRQFGYGGFNYHPRFWTDVVQDFIAHYQLKPGMKLLDVGCAKGFMLYDFKQAMPGLEFKGLDISDYAIENAIEAVQHDLMVGNAKALPFPDNEFDLVISVNTVHNLDKEECGVALAEIQRVSKGNAFVTVDAYRNEAEKERMEAWNLTAKTIMHVDQWQAFFKEVGYSGDFYWFMP